MTSFPHFRHASLTPVATLLSAVAMSACGDRPGSAAPAADSNAGGVIRYAIVAKYDGAFPVFGEGEVKTEADDRFEIDLKLDATDGSLIGEPVIANFGARLAEPEPLAADCDPPRRTTPFDLAEVTSVAVEPGPVLTITYVTTYAGAEFPVDCRSEVRTVAASKAEQTLRLTLPPPGAESGLIASVQDGWAISVIPGRN